jgi:hypothetical protein
MAERCAHMLQLPVTGREWQRVVFAAEVEGMTVGDYLRLSLGMAAEQDLQQPRERHLRLVYDAGRSLR